MTLAGIARRLRAAVSREPSISRAAQALAVFRVTLGLATLWQAVMTAKDLPWLVGEFGLMQWPINQALAPPALPNLAWFRRLWENGLLTERQVIYSLLALYLISLLYLIAGWKTKFFAVSALLFHLLFKASGAASIYGAHEIATNGLFFCILLPVSSRYALGRTAPALDPSGTRLARTVLRAYLSIVYLSSGVEKISGPAWRNGEAIWNFLMRPEVKLNFGWLSGVPWLLVAMGWFVLLVEIGYVICLFSVRARTGWFFGTLLMHLGIGLTFQLWVFSFTMMALNWGALGGFRLSRAQRNGPGRHDPG